MNEKRKTVFLVDDDDTNLLVGRNALSDTYKVFTISTGERLFEILEKVVPDAILLDVAMPGMDGYEVLGRLKADPRFADITVIFLTARQDDASEVRGLSLGAADFIAKPFKPSVLKARVASHIQVADQLRSAELLSLSDPLTGIPNRRAFDEHLEREWARAMRDKTPLAFLMLDLDKFKNYNDEYGHPQGDELLKAAAGIIASYAKRPADLAARIGGEEFGLLLPTTKIENARIVAERLRSDVEKLRVPVIDTGAETSITISVGAAARIPERGGESAELVADADARLYEAKESGRNRVCG
ncbi:hypothetical protein FACS1894202_06260 [Clostridia bacterium]|nr:hypothetical protein FACS1894202_06260 [Clostridia bacterium]